MLGFLVISYLGGNALAIDVVWDLRKSHLQINEVQKLARITVRWSKGVHNFSDQQLKSTAQELILEIAADNGTVSPDIILSCKARILVLDASESSPVAEIPISLAPVEKVDSLAEVKGSFLLVSGLSRIDRIAIVIDLSTSKMSTDRYIIPIPKA